MRLPKIPVPQSADCNYSLVRADPGTRCYGISGQCRALTARIVTFDLRIGAGRERSWPQQLKRCYGRRQLEPACGNDQPVLLSLYVLLST